ncbi:MAG: methyltransferase domain-containing protein [Bacteroidetes bacterium]|nr:methyltransferase domain-containing protein [Bacteroidota bacterium]
MGFKNINNCRLCKCKNLHLVLNLGNQFLTGIFLKNQKEKITLGRLELTWCQDCHLVQLNHSFDLSEMYGENYGYRSGLNQSMVTHLTNKIHHLEKRVNLLSGDCVIDIGSNDGTSLKAYTAKEIKRIGVDPTGEKFRQYYSDEIQLIPDFFPSNEVKNKIGSSMVKIITSIAMFYDLEDPIAFAQNIHDNLSKNGIWHFEQSYMPSMIRMNSYDTICHEHIEYYTLYNIKYILDRADMKIIDVQMNSINGGSFAVTATRKDSSLSANDVLINWLFEQELQMGFDTPRPFRDFEEKVFKHRESLKTLIDALNSDNNNILGYGASTKGNVLLQFCNFSEEDIPAIAEVNPDKFGCYTPGTNIPIISEKEAIKMKPDYYLVLPWHFKDGIVRREQEFLNKGGKLIFPFPEIEIIGG